MSLPIERVPSRGDLAWSIAAGGIAIVAFTAALVFAWYYAATLFLIFAGVLLGVGLTAMTHLLHKVIGGPHPFRLTVVCLVMAALISGVVVLGGTTIAQQATALSGTIKSQIINLKAFLEAHGVDTSYLQLNGVTATASQEDSTGRRRHRPPNRPPCRAPATSPPAAARSSARR